jgi:hypothetical protein
MHAANDFDVMTGTFECNRYRVSPHTPCSRNGRRSRSQKSKLCVRSTRLNTACWRDRQLSPNTGLPRLFVLGCGSSSDGTPSGNATQQGLSGTAFGTPFGARTSNAVTARAAGFMDLPAATGHESLSGCQNRSNYLLV